MTLKSDIDKVMSTKNRVFGKGFILKYCFEERRDAPLKLLVIAPKKRFKLAVTRNRIKRQLRDAVRAHKPILLKNLSSDQCLHLAIIYTGLPVMDFEKVESQFSLFVEKIFKSELNNN